MPGADVDDAPTLKELSRIMMDFREEWRSDKAQMVRKDVHLVEHALLDTRVLRLEQAYDNDSKTRVQQRNQFYLALFVGGLGLLSSVIMAVWK